MAGKNIVLFLLGIMTPMVVMAKQPQGPKVSPAEKEVIDAINKQNDEIKKQQEKVKNLVDRIAAEIERTCTADDIGCPVGWDRHGKSCYYIDDTPTQAWSDARAACKSRSADLPIIKSAEQNEFIASMVFQQDTITWGGVWSGIKRQADDKLYWIDGTPVAGGYTSWSRENPSNSGGNEDCAHLMGKADKGWEHQERKWNDIPCALRSSFSIKYPVILCEKSI